MRIATVGSCLSRQTAKVIPRGRIVNAVYHNRSDQLLKILQSSGRDLKAHKDLCSLLKVRSVRQRGDAEFSVSNVLHNQSSEGFGMHLVPEGRPFHETLFSTAFDLILVDNYMDTGARLYDLPDAKIFCHFPAKERANKGFDLDSRLTPEQSAANFREILEFLRGAQPDAQIVFMHFPLNNYPPAKQDWAAHFLDNLTVPDRIQVVGPRRPIARERGKHPQHFKMWEYRRYAAQVTLLRARWWLRNIWR